MDLINSTNITTVAPKELQVDYVRVWQKDSDGDGVPADHPDRCPSVPGPEPTHGCPPPTATTEPATAIGETSATLASTVDPRGDADASYHFEYGVTTGYAHTTSAEDTGSQLGAHAYDKTVSRCFRTASTTTAWWSRTRAARPRRRPHVHDARAGEQPAVARARRARCRSVAVLPRHERRHLRRGLRRAGLASRLPGFDRAGGRDRQRSGRPPRQHGQPVGLLPRTNGAVCARPSRLAAAGPRAATPRRTRSLRTRAPRRSATLPARLQHRHLRPDLRRHDGLDLRLCSRPGGGSHGAPGRARRRYATPQAATSGSTTKTPRPRSGLQHRRGRLAERAGRLTRTPGRFGRACSRMVAELPQEAGGVSQRP